MIRPRLCLLSSLLLASLGLLACRPRPVAREASTPVSKTSSSSDADRRIDVRTLVGQATRGSGPGTGAGSGAPEPGTRRWSNHLREYVILTRYVSDDEWSFVPESELRRMSDRAGAAWSEMPLSR